MSNIMWNRVHKLQIRIPAEVSRDRLDKEFEKATGKDCDEAAESMSNDEFRNAIASGIFLAASVWFTRTLVEEWGWLLKPYSLVPTFFVGLGITLAFLEFREI